MSSIFNHKPLSGVDFIENLKLEALNSSAVNHPYLFEISEGSSKRTKSVIQDFAFQYGKYSECFSKFLGAVIYQLTNKSHKDILLENMQEELGNCHDIELPPEVLATVINQPHSALFKRFKHALHLNEDDFRINKYDNAGYEWANSFHKLCTMNQYIGIGAIGIGTELIVSSIYQKILTGIKFHTKLTQQQHVFFDLHSECDDEHAEQIIRIAREMAVSRDNCEQIEYGARRALELRVAFWNQMQARSQILKTSQHLTSNQA